MKKKGIIFIKHLITLTTSEDSSIT